MNINLNENDIKLLAESKSEEFNDLMMIEECSELQKAITKYYRHKNNVTDEKLNILEEMADVQICIEILKLQHKSNGDDTFNKMLAEKMERNLKRLEQYEK